MNSAEFDDLKRWVQSLETLGTDFTLMTLNSSLSLTISNVKHSKIERLRKTKSFKHTRGTSHLKIQRL